MKKPFSKFHFGVKKNKIEAKTTKEIPAKTDVKTTKSAADLNVITV